MGVQAKAMALPPGSVPRIKLQGEMLTVSVLGKTDSWEVAVEYPDGHRRHHMVHDVIGLLQKIEGQLRCRYNIDAFSFISIPEELSAGAIVKIGDIKYG